MAHTEFLALSGRFLVESFQPDGDSIRFLPDDPDLLHQLRGKPAGQANPLQPVQLRFQGLDAPELHYGGSSQPLGRLARNSLLRRMGFGQVRYEGLTVTSAENAARGVILARETDVHGRPISYALLEEDAGTLISGRRSTPADTLLEKTLNARMLHAGLAYPLFYTSMAEDHRRLFTAIAAAARADWRGVWGEDASGEFDLVDETSINRDGALIFPKLFRRATDYLRVRGEENFPGGLRDWLEENGGENDLVHAGLPQAQPLSELVQEEPFGAGHRIRFTADPLSLVFLERRTRAAVSPG